MYEYTKKKQTHFLWLWYTIVIIKKFGKNTIANIWLSDNNILIKN